MPMIAFVLLAVFLSLSVINADHLRGSQRKHPAALRHYGHNTPLMAWMDSVSAPSVHSSIFNGRKLFGINNEYDDGISVLNEVYRLTDSDRVLQVSGYPLNACICSESQSSLLCAVASAVPVDQGSWILETRTYEGNHCTEAPTTTLNTPLTPKVFTSSVCDTQAEISVYFEVVRGVAPYDNLGPGLASVYYGLESSCEHDQWARYDFLPSFECFCNSSAYGISTSDFRYVEYTDSSCSMVEHSQVAHFDSSACIGRKTHPSDGISVTNQFYYQSVHAVLPK
eukprot:scaffold5121_cov223-Ochromonas_danica.AAC.3